MNFAFWGPLRRPLGGFWGRLGGLLRRLEAILGLWERYWSDSGLLGRLGSFWRPSWPVKGPVGAGSPSRRPTREIPETPGSAQERPEIPRSARESGGPAP